MFCRHVLASPCPRASKFPRASPCPFASLRPRRASPCPRERGRNNSQLPTLLAVARGSASGACLLRAHCVAFFFDLPPKSSCAVNPRMSIACPTRLVTTFALCAAAAHSLHMPMMRHSHTPMPAPPALTPRSGFTRARTPPGPGTGKATSYYTHITFT